MVFVQLSRHGLRDVLVDSFSFKIHNFASWKLPALLHIYEFRDFVLCIVEFGVAAFLFETFS